MKDLITIIDSECLILTDEHQSSNKYKYTTVYYRKIALIQMDLSDMGLEPLQKEWTISMGISLEDLNKKNPTAKKRWKDSQAIHGLDWGLDGEDVYKVAKEIKKIASGGKIWAKGAYLEDRLMKQIGLQGKYICWRHENWGKKILVCDLNNIEGIEKVDTAMYRFKCEWKKRFGFAKRGNFDFHNPIIEVRHFLSEYVKKTLNK